MKYEAMFLMDPNTASNWETAETEIRRLLGRASATILGLKRWDERKLAYEIKRRKRGVYALAFFDAPGDKLAGLELDARLSEHVLRLLVLRHERLTQEDVDKALAMAPPPRSPERHGDSGMGGRGGPRGRERAEAVPEEATAVDVTEGGDESGSEAGEKPA